MDDDRQVVLLGESVIWNIGGVFRSEMQVTKVRLERDNLRALPSICASTALSHPGSLRLGSAIPIALIPGTRLHKMRVRAIPNGSAIVPPSDPIPNATSTLPAAISALSRSAIA